MPTIVETRVDNKDGRIISPLEAEPIDVRSAITEEGKI